MCQYILYIANIEALLNGICVLCTLKIEVDEDQHFLTGGFGCMVSNTRADCVQLSFVSDVEISII